MAYVASTDFTEYANHPNADSDDLALFDNLIARAQSVVEQVTGRVFQSDSADAGIGSTNAPVSRTFDADCDVDGAYLWLDRDLAEIVSITNGDGSTVPSSNYVTDPRNDPPFFRIKLLTSGGDLWTWSTDVENAITVSGVWAYSLTPPDDIKHAVLRLTNWMYKQRTADFDADRPAITDIGVTIMPAQLPADIMAILRPYKRLDIGFA